MSSFQRVKNLMSGILMLFFAALLLLIPEEGYSLITLVLSISLFVYGIKQLVYYFTMARHMVGGKSTLWFAAIILDLAVLTVSMSSMNTFYIIIYLMAFYVFWGAIDILRAFEAKRYGSRSWRLTLLSGIGMAAFAAASVAAGLFFGNPFIPVLCYSLSLGYSAVMKIVSAFRKTAIVYIQ